LPQNAAIASASVRRRGPVAPHRFAEHAANQYRRTDFGA
jgi:hypothetical protein